MHVLFHIRTHVPALLLVLQVYCENYQSIHINTDFAPPLVKAAVCLCHVGESSTWSQTGNCQHAKINEKQDSWKLNLV